MHYDAMQMQWNANECNASHAHLFFHTRVQKYEVLMNLIVFQE